MYKMIYMGTYNPKISECVANFKDIHLAGVILDDTLSESELAENRLWFQSKNIRELKFEDISTLNPNVIFLCGYTKLLKTTLLDKYLFVNVHAGILPKWRGKNANCWAILNGEKHVGYTLHRVREGMDNGEIFDITEVELGEEESYSSARERIKNIFCSKLEAMFLKILCGKNSGRTQQESDIVYTCKLRASDAVITNWNYPSSYIIGLFRVFGSGVFISIRQQSYKILKMTLAKEIASSIGIPGAVINRYADGSVLIKTSDTAVKLCELEDSNGSRILPSEILKIGMRL